MKRIILFLSIAFIALSLTPGCRPDPEVVPVAALKFTVPDGWPAPAYNFENNTLTRDGFELGRRLFYDPRLSRDNTISCGSCHQPFSAFAQLNHDFSHGVENRLGTRNSPPLFNLNWHTGFFWDGGVNHIESQPINPIRNPLEMDETIENIIVKLNNEASYKTAFQHAFGSDTINSQKIFKALAQFMGMLVSSNSRYDKHVRGESGGGFSAQEDQGLVIFKAQCASCHKEPLFSDFSYRNNGLTPSAFNDSGRAHITLDPSDLYKFKVPSLRNLKYTAPYMHDGRFSTLDQVLDHYASGIQHSATLDPALLNGIQLSPSERSALLAFLSTLNDENFVKDERFKEVKF